MQQFGGIGDPGGACWSKLATSAVKPLAVGWVALPNIMGWLSLDVLLTACELGKNWIWPLARRWSLDSDEALVACYWGPSADNGSAAFD